jgi:hypothetical protein
VSAILLFAGGCSAEPPLPAAAQPAPTIAAVSTPAPTTAAVPTTTAAPTTQVRQPAVPDSRQQTPAADDPAALHRRWQTLNDDCRGGSPGAATDKACAERNRVMSQQATASATAFLAAWRAGDAARMRQLSTADAQGLGGPLVPTLLPVRPAEQEFEMTQDVSGEGSVAAYIRVSSGHDDYLEWAHEYARGWLVDSWAPDVG